MAALIAAMLLASGCAGDGTSQSVTGNRPPSSAAIAASQTEISSAPAVATESTESTVIQQPPARVLLVGDSTLLAVERYRVLSAFRGFDYIYSAESCRTLGVPSCGDPPLPPNALQAILAADGTFDIVVVMAGYDEWWTSFPNSFDLVVDASRSKGAERIIWLTYREGVGYVGPDGATANEAFVRNNQTLRDKTSSGQFPDVVLADWYSYSAPTTKWLSEDGIHLTKVGARAVADYISRMIAFVQGLPCPMPWVAGGPIDQVCQNPDLHGPVADIKSLYPS